MPVIDLTWDTYLNTDKRQGNMAGTITSDWVHVRGRPFSLQMVWPATAAPNGTLSYQTSQDRINAEDIDTSLLLPTPSSPAGTASSTTVSSGDDLIAEWVRAKYTWISGGTAAGLTGKLTKGSR